MMKNRKQLSPLMVAASAFVFLSGCANDAPRAIFNPEGIYLTPPEGFFAPDLVDDHTKERTGPIYVPPGAIIIYETTELN